MALWGAVAGVLAVFLLGQGVGFAVGYWAVRKATRALWDREMRDLLESVERSKQDVIRELRRR